MPYFLWVEHIALVFMVLYMNAEKLIHLIHEGIPVYNKVAILLPEFTWCRLFVYIIPQNNFCYTGVFACNLPLYWKLNCGHC